MRVCVFGTGYVGLVAGVCFAEMGNKVGCFDVDGDKIAVLQRGESPIYEPGLTDMLKRNIQQNRLVFSNDVGEVIADALVIIIAVGTPTGSDGAADMQYIWRAAEMIGNNLERYAVIATKSTVPAGTANNIKQIVREKLQMRGLNDIGFDVISCPEFLKEGAAIEDFLKPDRVIVGSDSQPATAIMQELYAPFLHQSNRMQVMSVISAELTKYASNAMLATRISFMNELANLCEKTGADIEEIRRGIGADSRIGKAFLYAGAGFGGSCFPKDLRALAKIGEDNGYHLSIINSVIDVNEQQKGKMFKLISAYFNDDLKGKVFAVWGLAFKPNTDDMREAPAVCLIDSLLQAGAIVQTFDPVAMDNARKIFSSDKVKYCSDEYETVQGAEAIVLMTEWSQFRSPDFVKLAESMRQQVIFDGRNQYNPQMIKNKGFAYISIGRKNGR